jgi:(p)ppGpp synthase/HD superfamily hydrolase
MTVVDAERHQNDLVNELIASVEAYNPGVDKELIRRAFDEAERAHRGQVRRSGEPFINHPLGVALICAQLHLDEQTIAAALLHDVIEDTETDLGRAQGRVRAGHRAARRGRHQAHPHQLPEPRAGGGRRTTAR